MVGEPNPLTNLRPLKFHIPENETEIERRYRLKREEVQQWNDRFWARHNTRFFEVCEKCSCNIALRNDTSSLMT